MTSPIQARRAGADLKVNYEQVITGIHDRYQAIIGQLMQENAELTSGFHHERAEKVELQSKVAALQAGAGLKVVTAPTNG